MSDKKRSYQKPDIRFHDQPHNTADMAFLGIKLDSIHVLEWHPLPDGQGKPTQVHVFVMFEGLDVPLVMRFKGPGTLDAFISALAVHRFHVWPDRDDTDKEGLLR